MLRNNLFVSKTVFLLSTLLLLYGCTETSSEISHDLFEQYEPTHFEQQHIENSEAERDIIAELLEPIYHTREDATRHMPIAFYRRLPNYELVIEEGVFDYQRFFPLPFGAFFPDEAEALLAGEITAYEVIERNISDWAHSSVIAETQGGEYIIIAYRPEPPEVWPIEPIEGAPQLEFTPAFGTIPYIAEPMSGDLGVPTLEDILRNLEIEERLHATSLDLERTRVLVFSGMFPVSNFGLGFLFYDDENEYFLSENEWAFDPHRTVWESRSVHEGLFFSMTAGGFYEAHEVAEFISSLYQLWDEFIVRNDD